jgi:hypothetical protein
MCQAVDGEVRIPLDEAEWWGAALAILVAAIHHPGVLAARQPDTDPAEVAREVLANLGELQAQAQALGGRARPGRGGGGAGVVAGAAGPGRDLLGPALGGDGRPHRRSRRPGRPARPRRPPGGGGPPRPGDGPAQEPPAAHHHVPGPHARGSRAGGGTGRRLGELAPDGLVFPSPRGAWGATGRPHGTTSRSRAQASTKGTWARPCYSGRAQ